MHTDTPLPPLKLLSPALSLLGQGGAPGQRGGLEDCPVLVVHTEDALDVLRGEPATQGLGCDGEGGGSAPACSGRGGERRWGGGGQQGAEQERCERGEGGADGSEGEERTGRGDRGAWGRGGG